MLARYGVIGDSAHDLNCWDYELPNMQNSEELINLRLIQGLYRHYYHNAL
jgi:hypothetical protein